MTTLTATSNSKSSPLLLVLGIIAIVAAGISLTAHAARDAHAAETWSSTRVLSQMQAYAKTGNGCQRVEVAMCPNAVNHCQQSPNYGACSPQVRALCMTNPNGGIMGVFGLTSGVYITGYYLDYSRWASINRRDGCTAGGKGLGEIVQ
jgi:hypothetical protein